jgi:hypothetical protein
LSLTIFAAHGVMAAGTFCEQGHRFVKMPFTLKDIFKRHVFMTKFIVITLVSLIAGISMASESTKPYPLQNKQRVFSTDGFSFLPPQGSKWLEEFDKNQITYFKQTDLNVVSFYAGTLQGRLRSKLSTKKALLAFIRIKKDEWGKDARYFDTSSSFQIEDKNESCVRYQLSAHDRGAKNKAGHDFLLMHANGRFCVHPQDSSAVVDIYYSLRHIPQFNPKDLIAEGEIFLQSLQFASSPKHRP